MANRYFTQWLWSMEKNPAALWAKVTFGASGAPTLDGINSKGIKTITRVSAGKYTVVFGSVTGVDTYNNIYFAKHKFLKASTQPAAPHMYVVSQAVRASGSMVIQFLAPNGTSATDPDSGSEVWLEFRMKTSTAN